MLRQHRTIGVCGLRSKIFRQVVQKFRRLADASQEIFVQHDGNSFKQGVRTNLCGIALRQHRTIKATPHASICTVLPYIFCGIRIEKMNFIRKYSHLDGFVYR